MKDKIDFLRYVISRYDHYIATVNIKGNFMLAFNTFIIGAAFVLFSTISIKVEGNTCLNSLLLVFLGAVFFLACCSIWYILKAVYPFLKPGYSEDGYRSLIFFSSVAGLSAEDYEQRIKAAEEPDIVKDLSRQASIIAQGITTKFSQLSKAGTFLYWALGALAILLIYAIIIKLFV